MVRKREEYFAASARVVWIVDPSRGRGEIHRPGAQPVLIDQDGELAAEELLPGLRVRLGDVLRRAKRWTR
jgi:Uma2 family endonuclease